MRSLEEARAAIREIDVQMASLFQKRMEAAKDIAAYKKERGLQIGDIAHENTWRKWRQVFIRELAKNLLLI